MKKLLVVVDYQNDFVIGSLGFEDAVSIEDNIANKISEYRKYNCDIAFTFDTHDKNYSNTQEGINLPIEHCMENTHGWNLYGRVNLLKQDNDMCFKKGTFGSSELYEYLKKTQYSMVEIAGVVSNICVISNAVLVKTALPEALIIVDKLCIASNDKKLNEATIDILKSMHVKIINEV